VCIYGLLAGYLTPGDFLLVVMLSVTFLRNMYEVGRQFIDFFDVYGSALDSISTIIVPHELVDAPTAKPLGVPAGEVRFENVSFAYNDKTPIFAGFNLHIRAGEKVGLIGHSGAGKSTIASLLMRLYDVQGGGIILNDPAAVQALKPVAKGGRITLPLGGKGSRLDPGPVSLEVEKLSESDGNFTLEDRHSHSAGSSGIHVSMGPCAVVRHRGITILLTSKKTPPFDLGQWRSQGINPEDLRVIGVKALPKCSISWAAKARS
jgi:hypothetical protein